MTVGIQPRREEEADPRGRATPGRRASVLAADFRASVLDHVVHTCAKELRDASALDFYNAFAHTVRDRLVHRWLATQRTHVEKDVKRVCYFSSEFLTGRSLGLCLMNMSLYDAAVEVAADYGLELGQVLECEGDPGLGNGGLGRLAACFMDSLATLELPAIGYGIRYDFGMFEQKIDGGRQVEQHDNWLQLGNPWELPRHEEAQTVRFGGEVVFHQDRDGRTRASWVDTRAVIGLPYDSFIVGHRTDTANTLRLWAARATRDFDLQFFNDGDFRRAVEEKIDTENISKVLYPNDQSEEGKALRLKQQYFFVACSIADIVRRYKLSARRRSTRFADKVAIQLNDTHPSIAVAELMRVLLDEEGLDWDDAWAITGKTFGYTNHTLLPEALERWPVALFERLLPRHLQIIYEINQRFLCTRCRSAGRATTTGSRACRSSTSRRGKQVRMAHLADGRRPQRQRRRQAPHRSGARRELLHDFYELWPEKFNNKTNGVTPRRWILHANPRLTRLLGQQHRLGLDRSAGAVAPGGAEIVRRRRGSPRRAPRRQAGQQARRRRARAATHRRRRCRRTRCSTCRSSGSTSTSGSSWPACRSWRTTWRSSATRARRRCRAPTSSPARPRPATCMAKLHIRLLNDVAAVINADPAMHGRLAMAFVPNYGVSLAQAIIPAADLSVQISTAGKEASGTSNMKFALNGALTLGTLDGANIEIRDAVGHENFFLFGLTADEVVATRAARLRPAALHRPHPGAGRGDGAHRIGVLQPGRARSLPPDSRWAALLRSVHGLRRLRRLRGRRRPRPPQVYRDARDWSRRALFNIAGSSRFSSDATIRQYASEIWGLSPVKTDFGLLGERP